MRSFCLILFLLLPLSALEFTLVAHKDFPITQLSKKQLKALYLKKVLYLNGVRVVTINIASNTALREAFEKSVLAMKQKSLKMYWSKAHYQGLRPPKVVRSNKNILAYLENVPGSIAYLPKDFPTQNLHILKVEE